MHVINFTCVRLISYMGGIVFVSATQTLACLFSHSGHLTRLIEHLDVRVASRVSRLGSKSPPNERTYASVSGFKFRRRKITNFPTGGEGSCAHLVEATPCDEPSCFSWQLLRLEECLPTNDTDCGSGNQLPQSRCVDTDGEPYHTSAPYKTQAYTVSEDNAKYAV